ESGAVFYDDGKLSVAGQGILELPAFGSAYFKRGYGVGRALWWCCSVKKTLSVFANNAVLVISVSVCGSAFVSQCARYHGYRRLVRNSVRHYDHRLDRAQWP